MNNNYLQVEKDSFIANPNFEKEMGYPNPHLEKGKTIDFHIDNKLLPTFEVGHKAPYFCYEELIDNLIGGFSFYISGKEDQTCIYIPPHFEINYYPNIGGYFKSA